MNQIDAAADPSAFLREVASAEEGWSQPYGGPLGVAELVIELQAAAREQTKQLAAVRTAAIRELLKTSRLSDVARMLGVSKQAVSKAAGGPGWADPRW